MKRTVSVLVLLVFALTMSSCGKKKSQKQKAQSKGTGKVFKTDYLKVKLDDGWSVSEYDARKDNYSIFSFVVRSSGNIYNDFNKDHKQIGDVSETNVDGMPAITRIQEFMQNELKRSRVYLIYDGKNVISFNIAAPADQYDDEKAKAIIKYVSILHKGENVKLPLGTNQTKSTEKE